MSYCMYNCDPNPDEEYCDIYLYGDIKQDVIVCFDCCMNAGKDALFKKRSGVIKHMEEHKAMGHKAPYDRVIRRLQKEIDTEGGDAVFDRDELWTGDANLLQSVKQCIDWFRNGWHNHTT